jgi:toxin HigB-1
MVQTERVWSREYSKRIPRDIQERALMKLQQLNAAGDLKDLSIPSSNQSADPLRHNSDVRL